MNSPAMILPAMTVPSIALALFLPGLALAQEAQTLEGKHFKVVSDFEPKSIAEEILATAEATWDAQVNYYGTPGAEWKAPWTIHLYRFVNQFDAKDEELNEANAKEAGKYLFTVDDERVIHLGVLPYLADETIVKYGVPLQCLRELMSEITEIIRFEITTAPEMQPGWFAEGYQLMVMEDVLRAKKRIPDDPLGDPVYSFYFDQTNGLARRLTIPETSNIILGNTLELENSQQGLNFVWLRWMLSGKNKKRLLALQEDMLALPADDGFATGLEKLTRKAYKPGVVKKLDRDFKKYLRPIETEWTFRVSESQFRDGKILQISDEGNMAQVNYKRRPVKAVYAIAGKLTLLQDWEGQHQANLLVGQGRGRRGGGRGGNNTDEGEEDEEPRQGANLDLISIGVTAGEKAGVYCYHLTGGEYKPLQEIEVPGIEIGKPIDFRFEMRKQRMMAFILNGNEIFEMKMERNMITSFGLQANPGSTVLWEEVQLIDK